ncbi:hypothetical protein V496_02825 [Pseudogymnoascus sp. VKM F-4515 (FW-2607)]|nr:hypothetical protein V496_02825 [Pseudogymnoascus sp. VKM F-4515 (FW-2607)]KFZ00437.1 hypothetical protein V498_00061 [Pseudogymnoascus sp. VKM F-4517 (FW-2822)]
MTGHRNKDYGGAIPRTSTDYFPGPTHLCFDYAHFSRRIYEHVGTYEPDPVVSGVQRIPISLCRQRKTKLIVGTKPGKFIICSGLTPARGTDADFNAWYGQEHYLTISECTGFVRTRRYRGADGGDPGLPAYLTLHEFDGESLPEDELAKTAATE